MPSLFPQLFFLSELAPFLLRLVLGAIFITHGYPKIFKDNSQRAYFAGAVEFFGGIFLIVGFLTQLVAVLLAIEMIVTIWKAKFQRWEFYLALLVISLSLILLGPGIFSLDLPL